MKSKKLSESYAKEPGILVEYMDYLSSASVVSRKTAYNYYMTLRSLAKYLCHYRNQMDCSPDEVLLSKVTCEDMISITKDEWYQYLDYIEFTISEKKSSLAVRISIIHGFYRWLLHDAETERLDFIFQTKRPLYETKASTTLSDKDEETLCKCMSGGNSARNICMVRMFIRCGIGLQELHDLNLEDLNLDFIQIKDRPKEAQNISLDDVTKSAINAYLAVRTPPNDGSNAFLVSVAGKRLSREAIQKVFRQAIKNAPSRLHNITIRALENTAKERVIQRSDDVTGVNKLNIASPYYRQNLIKKYSK